MQTVVDLFEVTKRFGNQVAVDRLSLRIPQGCIYGFLGPNGAGKSTTLRMLMNIFLPDEGSLQILGQTNLATIRHRVGYLPEEKGLYKKMKVHELVTYFGRLKGLTKTEAAKRAQQLLERFGLGDHMNKRCEALSKGMGQKVQLLATLIHQPELLVLDEPFSGLDPVNAEALRDLILLQKREGRTVIYSTHVMEQAEQICDFIFLINKGKKIIDGPLAEVRRSAGQALQLDYDGEPGALDNLPGVTRVNDSGKSAELQLAPNADPQLILRQLIDRVRIRRFDLREASLHEIFVRAVGGSIDA